MIAVSHKEFKDFDYNLLDINPSLIIIDAANLLASIGSSRDKYGDRLTISVSYTHLTLPTKA